jgi:hypothetical protein
MKEMPELVLTAELCIRKMALKLLFVMLVIE